jgi:predicted ATPase
VVSGANAFAVTQVCERLDGLPLAIELAAPWLRVLNAEDLLHRLERRLQMLVGGARDLPPRQQTMRATLDWSYLLLEPEQQALLRRLSVFRGSIPIEAVERVCQAAGELPHPALDLLIGLVDQSLVRFQDCPERAGLAMLETVREYAGEQLEAAGEARVTVRAHAEHYAPKVAGDRSDAHDPLDYRSAERADR